MQRRGVLGGAVLLAIGGAFLLPPLGVPNAGAYLFVALGVAFAVAWWVGARRQYVYLVPACVLIGFGLGLVIPTLFGLPADAAGPVFLGALAFGVLLSAGILLLMDRNLGTSFYVPLIIVNGQIVAHKGGSPLLWQHRLKDQKRDDAAHGRELPPPDARHQQDHQADKGGPEDRG